MRRLDCAGLLIVGVGAIAYPAVLAVLGISVVMVLLIFFVPKFETIFAAMRQRGDWLWMTDLATLEVAGSVVRRPYGIISF